MILNICDNTYTEDKLLQTEQQILGKINFEPGHETVMEHINIAYHNKKIIEEDYHFSYLISIIISMKPDYSLIRPSLLAGKIIEFCLVLRMEPNVMEIMINNDNILFYLYSGWLTYKKTPINGSKDIFSKKKVF